MNEKEETDNFAADWLRRDEEQSGEGKKSGLRLSNVTDRMCDFCGKIRTCFTEIAASDSDVSRICVECATEAVATLDPDRLKKGRKK